MAIFAPTFIYQITRLHIHPPHPHGATAPSGPWPPHCRRFTVTLRHTTLGRTPLDEWSARRRELCITKHNTPKRGHQCPRRNSNLQSQQARCCRPTP